MSAVGNNYTIKGCAIRCRIELSPDRRRQRQLLNAKMDYLRANLEETKSAKCQRSMAIYALPGFLLAGQVKTGAHLGFWT